MAFYWGAVDEWPVRIDGGTKAVTRTTAEGDVEAEQAEGSLGIPVSRIDLAGES